MDNKYLLSQAKSFLVANNFDGTAVEFVNSDRGKCQILSNIANTLKCLIEFRNTPATYESAPNFQLVHGSILGDNVNLFDHNEPYANLISIDLENEKIKIFSSITGLPPVFYFYDVNKFILTSDLYLLRYVDQFKLEFNEQSLVDLCEIGHTIKLKTLFRNINNLPPGHLFEYDKEVNSAPKISMSWKPLDCHEELSINSFVETQLNLFDQACKFLPSENSFLSLTGGLDTRTVFAGAVKNKININKAITITGESDSLDAVIARDLCRRYNVEHQLVRLDRNFVENLDYYISKASLLSGGVHSMSQAHEIYFYEQCCGSFASRISGNMGNQVGRGGTEGVSLRKGSLRCLNNDFFSCDLQAYSRSHWLEKLSGSEHRERLQILLQDEIPNSMVGNYTIGNHYAVQVTPYSYKDLVDFTFCRPVFKATARNNLMVIRISDLLHRFWGESLKSSFQRRYVSDLGGYLAECPINWGWRASGGMDCAGTWRGLLSLIDVLQNKQDSPWLKKFSRFLGASGMHIYMFHPNWAHGKVKSFIEDNLKTLMNCDYFNKNEVMVIVDNYHKNRNVDYSTLFFLLDVALAKKNFINSAK